MSQIENAFKLLDLSMKEQGQRAPIPFKQFLDVVSENPHIVIRNIFQLFYDMVHSYVGEGVDEYIEDPESIKFASYDCSKLFVEKSDHPFFADRLFANRLVNLAEFMKRGAQQNKIYIFRGPHGCGKSTFLNNLLVKFEEFINTVDGSCYEIVWRLDPKLLGAKVDDQQMSMMEKLIHLLKNSGMESDDFEDETEMDIDDLDESIDPLNEDFIEVPCPSHDHPILMIPKNIRRSFFDDLLTNDEFKWKLFTDKQYEWVFKNSPCTICSSIYKALQSRLKRPTDVFNMVYVRPYEFNRRIGQGVSVFNPGDKPLRQSVMTNPMLQRRLNRLFKDSNQVKYLFSRYAKTNNGVYALMDIKSNNIERLIELHNIISEAVHKVDDIEENVTSLFIALMNPEDKKSIQDVQSFSDRIEYINIPYVLDLNTEVEIYRNTFGKHIDDAFLPRVLHNFARAILSSRLRIKSDALLEWIESPKKYQRYCDENLQLLKMEIYTGYIPTWLSEDDRKRFTAKRRRKIISESEKEGVTGFSGRDSIKIFNEFYSAYASQDKLIDMSSLYNFFTKVRKDLSTHIPNGFLDSLLHLYNYTILQEVKESLYYYNEEQIARDLKNYLFAINFEIGTNVTCTYTNEKIAVTEDFLRSIENRITGSTLLKTKRLAMRMEFQKEYTSKTLTQQIMVEGKDIIETELYSTLYDRYVYNLKARVLDPFLENENFRRAIKDYNEEAFKTFDKKIQTDVTFLMNNLCKNYLYTEKGAKEVCMYVIDNDLTQQFNE